MVMIMGFGPGRPQDLGEVAEVTCPNCRNVVSLHHWHSRKTFSLFFIPLVPYGREDYVQCPVCGEGVLVGPNNLETLRAMQDLTRQYRMGAVHVEDYRAHASQFLAAIGFGPGDRRPPPGPSPPPPPPPHQGRTKADMLADLARLHGEGVMSDAEYEAARRRLLDGT